MKMDHPSLTFFEKPGCITNAKQKKMLRELGVDVKAKSILSEPWSFASLMAFFESLPVASCFNENAPMVKSGEVVPSALSRDEAIALMLDEPILIKRPLIRISETSICGFDIPQICQELSLKIETDVSNSELHECSRNKDGTKEGSCP